MNKYLEEDVVKKIFLKVAIGINHLQQWELVHGDLNAENIYVNMDNHDVKVINPGFGFKPSSVSEG